MKNFDELPKRDYNKILDDVLKIIIYERIKKDNWKFLDEEFGTKLKDKIKEEIEKTNPNIDLTEIMAIILKLQTDGNIDTVNNLLPTISGIELVKNYGGYTQKKLDNITQKKTEKRKLILHYIYYIIATIGIVFALLRGGNNHPYDKCQKNCNTNTLDNCH